jgi:hypothetical protein
MTTKLFTSKTIIWIISMVLTENPPTLISKQSWPSRALFGQTHTKLAGIIFHPKMMSKKEPRRRQSDFGLAMKHIGWFKELWSRIISCKCQPEI